MAELFSTIGIFAKRGDPGVGATIRRLAQELERHRRRVILDRDTADMLGDWRGDSDARERLGETCDLVVVVGGDGTLLNAGRLAAAHDTPLLGINLGRVGFMVDVLPVDMPATLERILAGEYVRENRLLLTAWVQRADGSQTGPYHALNDAVVRNAEFVRVLEFDTLMDGAFISRHRADGIIVATPTGSTAYALSGGGPVLHPAIDALALVPICPHTLSDRPLIVDARHRVEIAVGGDIGTQALFTADGQQNEDLFPGDRVVVERAVRGLSLIHPPGYDYFSILRNKLQWGRGQNAVNPSGEGDNRGHG